MLRHSPKRDVAVPNEHEHEFEGGEVGATSRLTDTNGNDDSKKQNSNKMMWSFFKTLISFVPFIMVVVYHGYSEPRHINLAPHNVAIPSSTRDWKRTKFTLSSFEVAGVNLAGYGLGVEETKKTTSSLQQPFELFDDFDIAPLLSGKQGWEELITIRQDLERPSLSFYGDKIALKRWMPSVGLKATKSFLMKYASELTDSGIMKDESNEILKHLPQGRDYAAKPNHMSCSGGVWLTKTIQDGKEGNKTKTLIGHGSKPMRKKDNGLKIEHIADNLAESLHKKADCFSSNIKGSWYLKNVAPGILVEELFTSHSHHLENRGAMEFKVFTIWGRVWLGYWRPGVEKPSALLHRNGTALDWAGESNPLPAWLDWQHVVGIAEQLGANKDMYRTDIFVGIPTGSPVLQKGATKKERLAAVEYVVNECALRPTTHMLKHSKEIFDEGARLWLAGYMIGNYKLVANTEVPSEFMKTGKLSGKFED